MLYDFIARPTLLIAMFYDFIEGDTLFITMLYDDIAGLTLFYYNVVRFHSKTYTVLLHCYTMLLQDIHCYITMLYDDIAGPSLFVTMLILNVLILMTNNITFILHYVRPRYDLYQYMCFSCLNVYLSVCTAHGVMGTSTINV